MSKPGAHVQRLQWLHQVVEAAGAGTYEFVVGDQWYEWSPQLFALAGLPPAPRIEQSIAHQLIFSDDRHAAFAAAVRALEPDGPGGYDIEYRIVRPDGTQRWVRDIRRVLPPDEAGAPPRIVGLVDDVDSRKRSEVALNEARARFAAILLMAAEWYWEQDENLRFCTFSDSVQDLAGSSSQSHIGRTRWELPSVGVTDEQWAAHRRQLERREPFRNFEFRRVNGSGQLVWMSVSGDPFFDEKGRFKGYRGTGRNITEQKTWEETQRLLVSELNHRVKNTLATVQAIAANTLSRTRDPALFVETFSGRIQSLASAHTLLTRAHWQGTDLKLLITEQLALRGAGQDERITIEGPDVHLEPQIALPLALVIHELGTNARKYGSLSVPTGKVDIAWTVVSEDGARLKLTWVESNGPAVIPPSARSFGSVLIERSLGFALGGETRLTFEPAGVICFIEVPLESAAATALKRAQGVT